MDFKLSDFIYPFSILFLKKELYRTEKYDYEQLLKLQNEKLKELINYCYNNVLYYNRLFNKNKINPEKIKNLNDLKYIPVLTKKILKENFEALTCNVKNFNNNKPFIYRTSGSTGSPAVFYHDKYTNISKFTFFWRMWEWAGYKLNKKVALIGASFNKNSDLFTYKRSIRTLYINIFKINKENSLVILDKLLRFKPEILRGYPSSICNFFRFIEDIPYKKRLKIKSIITQSENLFDYQKSYIEKTSGAKVFNCFSQWEHICLAMDCRNGKMHHQMENGILEILDKDNNVLKFGEIGEITATGFYNRTMPLLRYKTGDIAIKNLSECDCGRKHDIIENLDGRKEDIIITPDDNFVSGLNNAVKFAKGMDFIQIVQKRKDLLIINIVKNNNYRESYLLDLEYKLRSKLGKIIKIEFVFVREIKPSKNGKMRFIISEIKKNQNIEGKWEKSLYE